ncbi:MAG TPA: excinuclease ABC subunit UvrA, partial [Gammaproteobacteria bacterium]|nr:excinuclease ABC subunit UvrA [Gammaproteobacteria bacterium]
HGFDVDTPFAELPVAIREVILHGSGERKIEFRYLSERGGELIRRHPFEGIIPNLERRYRETDSNLIREELAKFISARPCPGCGGARLNQAARHVFIDDVALPELTAWSVSQTQAFFARLDLPGRRGEGQGAEQ